MKKGNNFIEDEKVDFGNSTLSKISQKVGVMEDFSNEMLKGFLEGQRVERERIGRDLHDGIGCLLSLTRMMYDSIKPINEDRYEEVKGLLKETQIELKRIVNHLMPRSLEKLGLKSAIVQLCELINQNKEIEIVCSFKNIEDHFFEDDLKINIYRIVQELINNSVKHAKASKMELLLTKNISELYIKLSDNGMGMVGYSINDLSVKARIRNLEGKMFQARVEDGFEIEIKLPLLKRIK